MWIPEMVLPDVLHSIKVSNDNLLHISMNLYSLLNVFMNVKIYQ